VDRDTKLRVVGTGFGFTEGPVWDQAGSSTSVTKPQQDYPPPSRRQEGGSDCSRRSRRQHFRRQYRLIDCASVLRAIIEVTLTEKQNLADHYNGKKLTVQTIDRWAGRGVVFHGSELGIWLRRKAGDSIQGVYRLDAKGNVQLPPRIWCQAERLAFSPEASTSMSTTAKRNIRLRLLPRRT